MLRDQSGGGITTAMCVHPWIHLIFLLIARFNGLFDICIRQPVSFDKVFVVVRRCMSSWISVAAMKPQVVRTIGNTQFVLFLRLLAPRFKLILYWYMDQCMVVAIILIFEAVDLWDSPVMRFLSTLRGTQHWQKPDNFLSQFIHSSFDDVLTKGVPVGENRN